MSTGAQSPEELETLLEDAVVLHDAAAFAALFDVAGVLITGTGVPPAQGRAEIGRAAARVWLRGPGYLADQRQVLQARDVALVLGDSVVNVARRGRDRSWRFAISVLSDDSTDPLDRQGESDADDGGRTVTRPGPR